MSGLVPVVRSGSEGNCGTSGTSCLTTGRELARRIEISQSKVSRIEAGTTVPSLPEVRAWTGLWAPPTGLASACSR